MRQWASWALVIGLVSTPAATARDIDGEAATDSCIYLRLSLSTPKRVRKAAGDEALQAEYLSVFGLHLARAGFEVVEPSPAPSGWELYSHVESLGDGQLAWSYAFLPMPGLASGEIEFPTFSVIDRSDGERIRFSTYHGLDVFRSSDFPLRAAIESEKLANLFLPVALKLCAERESASQIEEAQLRRIRDELSAEIERVRRAQQSKQLELTPHDGDPSVEPSVEPGVEPIPAIEGEPPSP